MKGDGFNEKSPFQDGTGENKSYCLINNSSFHRAEGSNMLMQLNDLIWNDKDIEKWLIANFLPCDSVGMFHGKSGTYKSFIAIDIACHIASGIDFHGMRTEQGTVIYLAGEGVNGMKKRIKAWADIHQDVSPSVLTGNILFLNSVCIGSLKVNKENTEFKQLIEDIGNISSNVKLIIIDTQSVFNEGDENREETAKNFVNSCKHASVALGCSVLFIHHDGKNSDVSSGQTYRGSSAFFANIDYSLCLNKKDILKPTLIIEKMKDSESNNSFEVELSKITFEERYGSSLAVTSLTCCENVDLSRNNDKRNVFEDFLKYCSLNKGDTFGYEDFKVWRESKGEDDESIRRAYKDKNRLIDRWLALSYITQVESVFQGTKRKFNVV